MVSKKPGIPGFFVSGFSVGNFLIDQIGQHEGAGELPRLRDPHGSRYRYRPQRDRHIVIAHKG